MLTNRPTGSVHSRRQLVSILLGSGLTILTMLNPAGVYAADATPHPTTQAKSAVETYKLTLQPMQQTMNIGGTVIAKSDVTLTAQMPGRVVYLAGTEGDHFSSGQLLVALSSNNLMAKRAAALAQLSSAESAMQNAQVQYRREWLDPTPNPTPGGMRLPAMFDKMFANPASDMMGLSDQTAADDAALSQARTQMAQAQSAYNQAYAQIQQIDAKLRDTRSIAPFNGFIVHKYVELGDTVQPGQRLLDYSAQQNLQIAAQVPATLATTLQTGQSVQGTVDMSGNVEPLRLTVAKVFPTANPQTHTITVKFDLPMNTPARAGMYAVVDVPVPSNAAGPDSLLIPASAVVHQGGLDMVYVVGGDQRVHLRLVRLGSHYDNGTVQLLAGANPGETILLHPYPGIRSGDSLQQAETGAKDQAKAAGEQL